MDSKRIVTAQRQIIMAGARATRNRRLIATRPRLTFKAVAESNIQDSPRALAAPAPRALIRRADHGQILTGKTAPVRVTRRQP